VEVEETDELVLSDFSFSWEVGGHLPEILTLDRDAFFELFPDDTPARLAARHAEKRRDLPPPGSDQSPLLLAETPGGDLGGFIWGVTQVKSVHIIQVAVSPELRGVGLGETLLREFLSAMRKRGMQRLTTELIGRSLRASDFFQSVGFTPVSLLMECGLENLAY
jgi:ribosomal protein S18 acetylase RimI-like enzyme